MKTKLPFIASMALLMTCGSVVFADVGQIKSKVIQVLDELGVTTNGVFTGGGSQSLSQVLTTGSKMSSGQSITADDSAVLRIGGNIVATDVVTGVTTVQAQHAYSQAATHTAGANVILAGSIGSHYITIVSAAGCSGKSFAIRANQRGYNDTVVYLTDGADFTHSAVNATEASNLAGAVNANGTLSTFMTANAVGAIVYLTPKVGLYTLTLHTDAGGGNATCTPNLGDDYTLGNTGKIGIGGDSAFLAPMIGFIGICGTETILSGNASAGTFTFAEPGSSTDYLVQAFNADFTNEWEVYSWGTHTLHVGTAEMATLSLDTNFTPRLTFDANGLATLTTGLGLNSTAPVTGVLSMTEITDPGAGAANTARLYTRDNGSGKTQLVVVFNTGAAQVIATQP